MINVKEFLTMAFSYEDGMILRNKILEELQNASFVEVDFSGITVFTTMFFNTCSGYFVFSNSKEWYEEKIKFANLNPMGIETHKHSIENAQKRRLEKSLDLAKEITKKTITENS